MSFSQHDLDHLKKLARIQFDSVAKEEQFLGSMKNIVAMLEELQGLDISVDTTNPFMGKKMHLAWDQQDFGDDKALLANVQHPIMNNSIVVKSVLD
jgi:aspartyl/glutamyl-tRNA(Asn/Gln) amidotransferase C subunit